MCTCVRVRVRSQPGRAGRGVKTLSRNLTDARAEEEAERHFHISLERVQGFVRALSTLASRSFPSSRLSARGILSFGRYLPALWPGSRQSPEVSGSKANVFEFRPMTASEPSRFAAFGHGASLCSDRRVGGGACVEVAPASQSEARTASGRGVARARHREGTSKATQELPRTLFMN